jgi:hypothetical protein
MSTETAAPAETVTPETPAVEAAKADEPLGAPGLAALKSEREAKAAAEKRAAAAEARIKAFEDAQKTEAEKQAERLAEIERENAELKTAKTRAEVAAAKGVPANLLTGSTQAELEASADALIAFKGDTQPQRLVIPNEGNSPSVALNSDGLEGALKSALGID